jgi:hypothetical protein
MLQVMVVRSDQQPVLLVARIDGVQLTHDAAVRAIRALDLPASSTLRSAGEHD